MIPTDFEILNENKTLSEEPTLIYSDNNTDMWYQKDDSFDQPKAIVQMRVYTTDLNFSSSLEGSLFVVLWQSCVSEYLKEYTYMAANAALGFGLNAGRTGVDFSWAGYSDSMPAFIAQILKKVTEMRSADLEEIFDQVKEAHMLSWKNAYLQ